MKNWIKYGSVSLAVALIAVLVLTLMPVRVSITQQDGFLSLGSNVVLAVNSPPEVEFTKQSRSPGVAYVRTTEGSSTTDTLTLNIEVSSGTDRILVVGLAYKDSSVLTPTSIVFNTSENFVLEGKASDGGDAQCFLYYLVSPTETTADVVITMPSEVRMVGYVTYFTGIAQNNPFTAETSDAQGTNDTPTVDLTSAADEIAIDIMAQVSAGPDTITSNTGTKICDGAATGGGSDTRGGGQYEVGQATRTMSYTMSSTDNWNILAGALQEPKPPTVTTQAVDNILKTKSFGHGTITDTGGENCSKRGICWNTTGNPTVADSKSEEIGDIDVGASAIDRDFWQMFGSTCISKDNPANVSGTIYSVGVYALTNITDLRVGTFYTTNGNTLKCRDSELIGAVEAGAKRTFTELSIEVQEGDYIGCYFTSTGSIEEDEAGFAGLWTVAGEYIDPNDETEYTLNAGYAISLYGYTDSFGTGAFSRQMTSLTTGEHYYVKAYAYNSLGYGYGNEVEFGTLPVDCEVLFPNAVGSEESITWEVPSAADHYACVDEEFYDGDTSYVREANDTFHRDLYNLPASSGSEPITRIVVHFRCKSTGGNGDLAKASIKSDSTVTEGTVKGLTSGVWEDFTQEWALNPADTAAWEWSDIDSLQIGVSLEAYTGPGIDSFCTQVYVVVYYPDIDVGAPAIDRTHTSISGYTRIDKNNPANASGTIHTIKIWANEIIFGMRVGTFYTTNGNTLKCRDSEAIGAVEAGAVRTFTGLSITVEAGDYIGAYWTVGTLERSIVGEGYWSIEGEYIDPNDEVEYTFYAPHAISLYGYGDIADGADISNTPDSKAFGIVELSTSVWSSGSAPSWPLDDSECYFTITNNGDACSITCEATNFTGTGTDWTLGVPAGNVARLKAGKSGDTNEEAMVTLTNSPQAFISGLVTSIKWEIKLDMPTSADKYEKTGTITLVATLD